jgi:hypothetical protein
MSATIQRDYYRNGQLREEVPLRKGLRHGMTRTWHKSGRLALEEPYANGLRHGIARQWKHGTGDMRDWHDNGRLQMEMPTVRGEFYGRSRVWLVDGTTLSDKICLHNRKVSVTAYRKAAAKDPTLPKLRGRITLASQKPSQKKIHHVFVTWLLQRPNSVEACAWLTQAGGKRGGRFLGRFKSERATSQFVEALYEAGAAEVIAPDTYSNPKGEQFADYLVVRLPKEVRRRKAVRLVGTTIEQRKLGAMEPDKDIGETHLFLSLS